MARFFTLGTDVEIIRYPDRYSDERGTVMWHRILEILDGIEAELPHGWEVDMGLAQQKHSIGERNYQ